ncbi:MAG: protein kinase domain-containing protein [Myxococcota bacterium]
MSQNLPQKYGKYLLLRKIAMGGMAEIFRAKTLGAEGFEKQIVIKRILPHYTDDESFVKMFIDEASIASKLQHSNIVQIYDFDQEEDRYYIAMEYVEGSDLKTVIERGLKAGTPLSPAQCVWIMMELAKGLHYAHAKEYNGQPLNIVHRDISPHNVMVSYTGEIKLMDFGIAKAAQRSTKTLAGTVKGKCAYMSPEQARGKPLDGRSDLFALGIMLWEMLTQKRLFLGDSDFETLSNVLKADAPPPSSVNPNVPEALDAIVARALAKSRDDRHESVEVFGRELTKWFYGNVDDLDAVQIKPYVKELFADDIQKLREEYEEEQQMTAESSSPSQPAAPAQGGGGHSDRTVALPTGDPQAAETVMDGELSASQVNQALAQQAPNPDGATVALPAQGAAPGSNPSNPAMPPGMHGTGDFQQATGAFPQGHTGTYAGQRPGASPLTYVLLGILLLLVAGVGWFAWNTLNGSPRVPAASPIAQDAPPGAAATASAGSATLDITVEPYSASVTADGRPVDGTIDGLSKGQKVQLVAEAPGYEPHTETVTVTSERQSHRIELQREAPVAVLIKPSDPEAEVWVGDEKLGSGAQQYKGKAGEDITVKVQPAGGGEPVEKTVTLSEDTSTIPVEVATGPESARVVVSVEPDDATVTADRGKLAKEGEAWVITGVHVGDEVKLAGEHSGYEDAEKTLTVEAPNEAVALKLDKRKRKVVRGEGSLRLNAKPWAKVSVDGVSKGTTPANVSGLSAGRRKVVFKKGGDVRTKYVTVRPNRTRTVFVDFSE